jgi:hypothetical protein
MLRGGVPRKTLRGMFGVSKSTVDAIAAGRFHNDV